MNHRIRDVIVWSGVGLGLYAAMKLLGDLMYPKVLMALAYFAIAAFGIAVFSAAMFAWEIRR